MQEIFTYADNKKQQLESIPQLQFIQNGTEIISYRSLAEKQFCGNLLIAVSVGNEPDDIQLPFADVSGSIIKSSEDCRSSGILDMISVPNTV